MRTVLLGVFYFLFLVFITPYLAVCFLTGMENQVISLGQRVVRLGCRFLRIELEVSGLDRLDPRATYIFMANHLSFLDGPVLAAVIDRPVRIILKKSLFRIPILGAVMRFVEFVPVDRKRARGGQKSVRRAIRLVRELGYSFLVFPEGTRSRNGAIQPFRRGGFFLALESGAPIVPVTVRGTFELMPRGQWYARPGKVRFIFHVPVPVEGYTRKTLAGLVDRVKKEIASELD
jgi:1-acyl-sn-glycerol-3-phosphate acyltransferase